MELPKDVHSVNNLLEAYSRQLRIRHEMCQKVLEKLKSFDGNPRNIEIPGGCTVADAEAIRPTFERIGFRVEIRHANNSRPYFRFFQGD